MDKKEYYETINEANAKYILTLTYEQFETMFWNKAELSKNNESFKLNVYHKSIQKYLRKMVTSKCTMKQTYEHANGCDSGRLYVKGFGIQSLQHNVRDFLIKGIYNDYDMVNCHFSIALDLAIKNKVECPLLKEYVSNRAGILENNNLTKISVLIALNTDKLVSTNAWLKRFHYELSFVKAAIIENTGDLEIKTKNMKNPIGSKFNKILCHYENIILQSVITDYPDIAVPMFDGFLIPINTQIDFSKYQIGNIKFINKPVKQIEIPDYFQTESEYELMKADFETEYFQIKFPPLFMCRVEDINYKTKYQYMVKGDVKNNTGHFIFEGPNGPTSFFNEWLKDADRRMYESVGFYPYGINELNLNTKVYNTFEPFTCNIVPKNKDICTKNFYELVRNLSGDVDIGYDYLLKYICHLMQYPEERPDVMVVLKGNTGVGKDKLIDILEALMGVDYAYRTSKMEDVFGAFNESINDKLLLQFNEVEGKDSLKNLEKLKDLTTVKRNNINIKNVKIVKQLNYLRIFLLSNNKTPVIIQANDRRTFIVESTDTLKGNIDFFTTISDDLENQAWIDQLYTELANVDLSDFNVKQRPKTELFKIMQYDNILPIYHFCRELLQNKLEGEPIIKERGNKLYCVTNDFVLKYLEYLKASDDFVEYADKPLNRRNVKKNINEITGAEWGIVIKINGKSERCILFEKDKSIKYVIKQYFDGVACEKVLEF